MGGSRISQRERAPIPVMGQVIWHHFSKSYMKMNKMDRKGALGKRALHTPMRCAGAGPGFSIAGGVNPPGGHQHTILPNCPKTTRN